MLHELRKMIREQNENINKEKILKKKKEEEILELNTTELKNSLNREVQQQISSIQRKN